MVRRKKLWLLLLLCVRYQTITIIGYQNYTRTEHDDGFWLLLFVFWLSYHYNFSFNPPKAYFSDLLRHNSAHSHINILQNLKHFGIRLNVVGEFKLICIFIRISHYNFVTLLIFSYRSFFCHFFPSWLCTVLSRFLSLLDVVFRIWFPLIGAIIAIQSSLWAFKVFSSLACWMYLFPSPIKTTNGYSLALTVFEQSIHSFLKCLYCLYFFFLFFFCLCFHFSQSTRNSRPKVRMWKKNNVMCNVYRTNDRIHPPLFALLVIGGSYVRRKKRESSEKSKHTLDTISYGDVLPSN